MVTKPESKIEQDVSELEKPVLEQNTPDNESSSASTDIQTNEESESNKDDLPPVDCE